MRRRGPFPGIDSWLQDRWGSFQSMLYTHLSHRLNEELAPGVVAAGQERVIVDPGDGEYEQPYIEIIDVHRGRAVVTVVEIVSPSNKHAGNGRDQYVQHQTAVEASDANLVEIDLIRGYRGVTLAWKRSASVVLERPYHICTRRTCRPHMLEVHPIELRRRLPNIAIPLREGEPDIAVDLQDLLAMTYMRGRFEQLVDYDRPPEPPLDPDDAAWAGEQIAAWRAGG